jgi:hypothetical protein
MIPQVEIAGAQFSHEYINYMLGGSYRASFRPLNDAIMSGRIRGVAAIVGCNNPRSQHDYLHTHVTRELLKQDVLVVETGCGAIASQVGLLLGEAGLAGRFGPARFVRLSHSAVLRMGSWWITPASHRAAADGRGGRPER